MNTLTNLPVTLAISLILLASVSIVAILLAAVSFYNHCRMHRPSIKPASTQTTSPTSLTIKKQLKSNPKCLHKYDVLHQCMYCGHQN